MNTDNSLVSILIPVYNRATLIERAVHSALAQTYSNIEVIISDNCSTDGTWGILERLASGDNRIKIYQTSVNLGPVPNWLNCFTHSKGQFIKFLFSDDWMRSDCVERLLNAIKVSNCAIAISSIIEVDPNGKEVAAFDLGKVYPEVSCLDYRSAVLEVSCFTLPLSPGAALYQREYVKIQIHHEDPEVQVFLNKGIGPDILLFLSISRHRGIAIVPCFLNFFQSHKSSLSSAHSEILFAGYWRFLMAHLKDDKLRQKVFLRILGVRLRNWIKRFVF